MFTLTHNGDPIGTTKLESGDPATLSVSGAFKNVGGAKALAGWLKSIGGTEDNGVVFSVLNEDFQLLNQDKQVLSFQEATLIAIPNDDETYLDISGLAEASYKTDFAQHISATAANEDTE